MLSQEDYMEWPWVLYDVTGLEKRSALRAVCDRLVLPEGVNRDDLYAVLLAREALGSTGIGNGIAIPHPRSPLILSVKRPSVTLAFLRQPVDFGALDGRPVGILFTIISTTIRLHLSLLSHLMHAIQDAEFARLLHRRAGAAEILGAVGRVMTALPGAAASSEAGR